MSSSTPPLPLAGRKIIDCSPLMPGALAAYFLGELGAEVTYITRAPSGSKSPIQAALDFANRKKKVVHLDLKTETGQKELDRLVSTADALIEGYRPETRKKLGLDWSRLHALRPTLAIVSIVGYPEGSAAANRPGHDLNFQATSGVLGLFNELPGLPLGNLFSSYQAALTAAANMDSASRTGVGTATSVGVYDTLRKIQEPYLGADQKTPDYGQTLITGKFPCYQQFETSDGKKLTVAAMEGHYWNRFCDVLELDEFKDQTYAVDEQKDQVVQTIAGLIGQKSLSHWIKVFKDQDCCVEPVLSFEDKGKSIGL